MFQIVESFSPAMTAGEERMETPPGRQLQIDFGSTFVPIGGEGMRVYLFVATLGYSRRGFVAAFRHERQPAWFEGLEAAFQHFGGVPREVLLDNAKPLVVRHDAVTREVVFNERPRACARYWGFRPRACAPYRARTKGKDENGVGYVKKNAIAGRRFACWAALEAHLVWWMREVADQRIHGTTGEPPIERFRREEAAALAPLMGRPPFRQVREVVRRVQADGSVDLDTNHYSVPWRQIGKGNIMRRTPQIASIIFSVEQWMTEDNRGPPLNLMGLDGSRTQGYSFLPQEAVEFLSF